MEELSAATLPNLTPQLPRNRLRKWWIARTWRLRMRWGQVKCALNQHQWLDAPGLDKNGEVDLTRPSRYMRCKRPKCQVFRGRPALVHVDRWAELDGMLVICRLDCHKCYGRGFSGKMVLERGVRAQIPCPCIRVQPAYIERTRS